MQSLALGPQQGEGPLMAASQCGEHASPATHLCGPPETHQLCLTSAFQTDTVLTEVRWESFQLTLGE